jgi:Xaa-Pro aminopeptidase
MVKEYREKPFLLLKGLLSERGQEMLLVEDSFPIGLAKKLEEQGIVVNIAPPYLAGLRSRKSDEELAKISRAVEISEQAFLETLPLLKAGVKEREIALELDYRMRLKGADELAFPTIVAFGERSALPHATPGERSLKEGDWVLIDWGARVEGYCADITRTLCFGANDPQFEELFEAVFEAQREARAILAEGVDAAQVDEAARSFLKEKGWGDYFVHGLGHGVGVVVHEEPRLAPQSKAKLERGMVVTIEPGVYLPEKGGIRIENLFFVDKEGSRKLTSLPERI